MFAARCGSGPVPCPHGVPPGFRGAGWLLREAGRRGFAPPGGEEFLAAGRHGSYFVALKFCQKWSRVGVRKWRVLGMIKDGLERPGAASRRSFIIPGQDPSHTGRQGYVMGPDASRLGREVVFPNGARF